MTIRFNCIQYSNSKYLLTINKIHKPMAAMIPDVYLKIIIWYWRHLNFYCFSNLYNKNIKLHIFMVNQWTDHTIGFHWCRLRVIQNLIIELDILVKIKQLYYPYVTLWDKNIINIIITQRTWELAISAYF